jgi:hypothetical protein
MGTPLVFGPWEPDKGSLSATSIDTVVNALPLSNGWGPMPNLTAFTQALGADCKGAWWYRSTDGVFNTIAATQTGLFKLNSATLAWTDISKLGGYIGPGAGALWTAALFGTKLYVANINDPLQVLNIDSGTNFANAPGSPPQAKFVATVGDFIFLAHLKVGATVFPRKWQHCAVNDPTSWTITGVAGASDDQEIPDGEEITGILAIAGSSARIFQRKARRMLIFSPGSNPVFQQIDVDAPAEGSSTRGAVAPHAIVPLGGTSYFFLNETGFYLNDEYQPIGAERVDTWFMSTIDLTKLGHVQAVADASRKIIWVRFLDQGGTYKMIGYNWQLDRWTYSDVPAAVLVSSATPGFVLDALPNVLDTYSEPLDSSFWQGGAVTFGAFKTDGKLYLFSGDKAAATIETATVEFNPDMTSFVSAASMKGDVSDFTLQVGASMLADSTLSWSAALTRSSRTGKVPFRSSGRFHRIRANISSGGNGTHVHGVTVDAQLNGAA